MNDNINVLTIFGTRPEAIKMAPLVQELQSRKSFCCKVAVTAQHREMLDQVLSLFNITPDFDLDIMTDRQTLFDITSKALLGLEKVIDEFKPDIVLVHGDTTTTFVGALAAFYKKVKVGHVEAGLRTFNKWLPYPEEMNRRLTGVLADVHLSPTNTAKQNLLNEGISEEDIFISGNTVIDALKTTVKKDFKFKTQILNDLDFNKNKIILVTAHRRENLGKPLESICQGILDIVKKNENISIVYPVHLNPVVKETAKNMLGKHERIHLLPPLNTDEMHNLMSRCFMVLTDSGGLQEEAPSLGKPVLVLRNETERPEAVKAGTVKIIGTNRGKILSETEKLINDKSEYDKMAKATNPYGDGLASKRIADFLLYYFRKTNIRPKDF